MNKILLLLLISLAISKDLIIVGDERLKEMAYVLFEAEDQYYTISYNIFIVPSLKKINLLFMKIIIFVILLQTK